MVLFSHVCSLSPRSWRRRKTRSSTTMTKTLPTSRLMIVFQAPSQLCSLRGGWLRTSVGGWGWVLLLNHIKHSPPINRRNAITPFQLAFFFFVELFYPALFQISLCIGSCVCSLFTNSVFVFCGYYSVLWNCIALWESFNDTIIPFAANKCGVTCPNLHYCSSTWNSLILYKNSNVFTRILSRCAVVL